MNQTSFWLILFVLGFACLPWVLKWVQKRTGLGVLAQDGSTRLVSSLALSPQQRVVTVEIKQDNQTTRLVLGVTPQAISCLYVLPAHTPVLPDLADTGITPLQEPSQ